jgi:hypothetical protein
MIFVMLSEITFSQNAKYKVDPKDESNSDKTLFSFIQTLKQVCKKKDTSGLYKMLDSGIVISYGGNLFGKKDFISHWNLQQPDSSSFWDETIAVINLGGVFDTIGGERFFCFPYATSYNPVDWNTALDSMQILSAPFNIMVCIGDKVPVYKNPDQTSQIIDFLSYDFVVKDYKITQKQTEKKISIDNWEYVTTIDKRIKGWVMHKYFYYITGPDLRIRQVQGAWKISCYCSYD